MKLSNNIPKTFKFKTLGLPMAAALMTAGLATAHADGRNRHSHNVSGHVEVVKHVPGGVVTVGAEWGRPRPPAPPTVVVVEQRPQVVVVEQRPQVVVVEKVRPRHREVVVVREAPRRHVTVVRDRGHHHGHKKVVIVEKGRSHGRHGHHYGRGNDHGHHDGRKNRHGHHDGHGNRHGDRQISHSKNGPNGQYHYYEDANQISISDNRHGRQEHVYVRK